MIVTQSVQMFFSAVLAAITLLGHVQLWEVYAIAALTGTALVFDAPSRQNLTFQMVGRDELPNAIALNSSLFNTARIFGPALAGVLIAAFGAGWCFAINSVSFLAVLGGLLAMRVAELYPLADRRRPTIWRGTREGFAYARRNRTVWVILMMMVVFSSICFNFNIAPAAAREGHARRRAADVRRRSRPASAPARSSARSSAAAMANARWRVMFIGAAGFGISELLLAPLHTTALAGALLFVCGVFFTSYTATSNTVDPAREPRLHPRPRDRPLLLRLERAGAARRAARRLDVRPRRHRAHVRRRRSCALALTGLGAAAINRPRRTAPPRVQPSRPRNSSPHRRSKGVGSRRFARSPFGHKRCEVWPRSRSTG